MKNKMGKPRKLGKHQRLILVALTIEPCHVSQFSSVKSVLATLVKRGLVKMQQETAFITEKGSIHVTEEASQEEIARAKNTFFSDNSLQKTERLATELQPQDISLAETLRNKYKELFSPLTNQYSEMATSGSIEDYKRLHRTIVKLIDKDFYHADIIQKHYRGESLSLIGKTSNLSRERVRQIVAKYKGYYVESGSKEWCVQQLEMIHLTCKEKKIFPSNEELISHHPKLLKAIEEHFAESSRKGKLSELDRLKVAKLFNYDVVEEVKKHRKNWSEDRLVYEVRQVAVELKKPTLMPMQTEMSGLGRTGLRGAVQRFGGQYKVAQLAGLQYQGQTVGDTGRTYWTEERIKDFLHDVADKERHPGYMPTQAECNKHMPKGKKGIVNTITQVCSTKKPTLSWFDVAQKYGLKYDSESHRITIAYVKSFVQSLGDALYNLTPSEIYVLFEQQGINKTGVNTHRSRTFDNLVSAIQSGNLPQKEIDKWAGGQPVDVVEALLDPKHETVEDAFRAVKKSIKKDDHKSKLDNPTDEKYQEEIDPVLPAPSVDDTLKSLSKTTDILIEGSSDKEAIGFLIAKAKAKLWKRCFFDEETAISEAKKHRGNAYSEIVRDAFIDEYTRCKQLPIPSDYSFKDDSGTIRQPKLMQRLIAYKVFTDGRVLNLSGTGTGKTLSAVLASRIIGARIIVIACPNSTVKGWVKTITNAFPKSNVSAKPKRWMPSWPNNDFPCYLVVNHEMFQNRFTKAIKAFIKNYPIDFVVIDELHQVKQRKKEEESQRRHLINGIITDVPTGRPKPRVLGMSATPIINNLQEGKSLIELVSSLSQDDIGIATTVPNCMKLYQKFTTMGFRMVPPTQKSRKPNVYPIDATPYLEELFSLGKNPHPQQIEAVLVKARWPVIKQQLLPKTVIFTEYVKDIVPFLVHQIKETTPLSVGIYTGGDKYATEAGFEDMLEQFIKGDVDVLVASIRCLGTGIDGLQHISNNVIFACLPWTSTDYEQAIGRFDREGFIFDSLNIHVPKTYALLSTGEEWSWCQSKLDRLENKRDVARAAVDGEIPDSNSQLTPDKATQYWMSWLQRLGEEGLNEIARREIRVPLDETNNAETDRRYASYGDFARLNSRWNRATSSKTNERLRNNPEEWCYYHTRMNELEAKWQINPREECINYLRENLPSGSVIADFGCGQAGLAEALIGLHSVHSYDHIAVNRSVVACDMSNIPLDDNSLNAAVFSLSLMGTNLRDYILEAYRTLSLSGQLIIYHPAKENDRKKFVNGLENLGFLIVRSDQIYKWHYILAIKQGHQRNTEAEITF